MSHRLAETGLGSILSKQNRSQRTCIKCGSTNLTYPSKYYCLCGECGYRDTKRKKISKEKNMTTLGQEEREIPVSYGNRNIGVIRGNRYISHRDKTHFVKKYIAFGITTEIFDYLLTENVKEIVIIYTKVDKTQEVYYSDVEIWKTFAIKDKLGGFEEQMFLDRKYMKRVGG